MDKKVIVVTGGAQGIGREITGLFLSNSWYSAVWEIDSIAATELDNLLNNIDYFPVICDVANENQVKEAVNITIEKFGRIDLLVNNAAIQCNKPFSQLSFDQWQRVINVNLSGTFLCSKYCEEALRISKGRIVNICSTRAFQSGKNTEAYSASKGGVFSLTHAMAVSFGPDIMVNSISPGWIDQSTLQKRSHAKQGVFSDEDHTQHPAGRIGQASDIARMVWFLAQPENDFITGQNFVIDGGMTKKMIYV